MPTERYAGGFRQRGYRAIQPKGGSLNAILRIRDYRVYQEDLPKGGVKGLTKAVSSCLSSESTDRRRKAVLRISGYRVYQEGLPRGMYRQAA
ncbi:hypothetical protein [Treponema endosymbiont of Eucomonympha sp.]|uniref:hypothetical protein n=1 Tax=Treponema endosymbiont of Eucomonympha sp. TaxID=1580831 RepID=UPI000A9932E1|nr:hypothetical protein [Treponema endosymbiont of Eucomonympha sp.]